MNTDEGNPIHFALALWHPGVAAATGRRPIELQPMGKECQFDELQGNPHAESCMRGGNGRVAVFQGDGWYQIEPENARGYRPQANAVTLYVRAWVPETDVDGTLFFSDTFGLAIDRAYGVQAKHGVRARSHDGLLSYGEKKFAQAAPRWAHLERRRHVVHHHHLPPYRAAPGR